MRNRHARRRAGAKISGGGAGAGVIDEPVPRTGPVCKLAVPHREPREARRDQREDRPEVAPTAVGGGYANGTEAALKHGTFVDGRGCHRGTACAGATASGIAPPSDSGPSCGKSASLVIASGARQSSASRGSGLPCGLAPQRTPWSSGFPATSGAVGIGLRFQAIHHRAAIEINELLVHIGASAAAPILRCAKVVRENIEILQAASAHRLRNRLR